MFCARCVRRTFGPDTVRDGIPNAAVVWRDRLAALSCSLHFHAGTLAAQAARAAQRGAADPRAAPIQPNDRRKAKVWSRWRAIRTSLRSSSRTANLQTDPGFLGFLRFQTPTLPLRINQSRVHGRTAQARNVGPSGAEHPLGHTDEDEVVRGIGPEPGVSRCSPQKFRSRPVASRATPRNV